MTEKECAADRGDEFDLGFPNHHALLAAQKGRIAELERENAQYRALLLLRKDGRPEWQAHMEDAEHECDEARAALTFIRDQFPSVWEHEEFAPFRRVIDSKADPPKREGP